MDNGRRDFIKETLLGGAAGAGSMPKIASAAEKKMPFRR